MGLRQGSLETSLQLDRLDLVHFILGKYPSWRAPAVSQQECKEGLALDYGVELDNMECRDLLWWGCYQEVGAIL